MAALIEAAQDKDYPAEVVIVISNRPSAGGIERSRAYKIQTEIISSKAYSERFYFEEAIDTALRNANVDIVCLAGFMKILSPTFIGEWENRILNIHPSLLPKFPGLHTHEQALAAGAKLHGCTVHMVTEELDAGPIVMQSAVPVLSSDTPETLAERVLAEEVRLYPKALARIAAKWPMGNLPL